MPRELTRLHWVLILAAVAAGCGGGGGKRSPPPRAEEPSTPEPEVVITGALEETPGQGRTAELTKFNPEVLVGQGYLFIGTVATQPGPRAQEALLKTAGDHGGELILPLIPEKIDLLLATEGACVDSGAEAQAPATTRDGDNGDCAKSRSFPMLGRVWARPGDAPEEVVARWRAQDAVRRLHAAIAGQDLQGVSDLVSAGVDINAPDDLGRHALYKAALSNDDEYVAIIVSLGASSNPPSAWGRTFLEDIIDIELRRYEGDNFLSFNIEGHRRIIASAVTTGVDTGPALRRAVRRGFCGTADFLVEQGAKGEPCDEAAKEKEKQRQEVALGRAYRVALDEGRFDDANKLLKDGIDIGFVEPGTEWEAPPIEKAIADGNPDAVEFLLKKRVAHTFGDSPQVRGLICASALKANRYMVQLLLKAGVDLTGGLHCAVLSDDAKRMVPLFLAARVDIDGLNAQGESPLYALVKSRIIELKTNHGYDGPGPPADPTAAYTADRDALDKSMSKIIIILLKKGANPRLAPEVAPTAVELAERHGLATTAAALTKAASKRR